MIFFKKLWKVVEGCGRKFKLWKVVVKYIYSHDMRFFLK